MTKYDLLEEVKEQLKTWAKEIRLLKISRKQDKRENRELYEIEGDIFKLKYKYRHCHIAYCEMRGTSREKIEKPAENNWPNENEIGKIKKEWISKIDENVCVSSN